MNEFHYPTDLPVMEVQMHSSATLYAVGEKLSSGTLRSCLMAWTGLTVDLRKFAYIQLAEPVYGKRMLRREDIASLTLN